MKTNTFKRIVLALIGFVGVSTSITAQAIQISGTLGVSSVAVDSYSFTCPTGTTRVGIRVTDTTKIVNLAATIYATFGEDGSPTLSAFDNDNTSAASPVVINTVDGPGNYVLVVSKSAFTKQDDYLIDVQCQNRLKAVIGPARLITHINQ